MFVWDSDLDDMKKLAEFKWTFDRVHEVMAHLDALKDSDINEKKLFE